MRTSASVIVLVLTLSVLIVPYMPSSYKNFLVIYSLLVLGLSFTLTHAYGLHEKYWILPGVALTGLLLEGFLDRNIILLLQYLLLITVASYYHTPIIHGNENQVVAYVLVVFVSGLVGLFINIWYLSWIILGPFIEYYSSVMIAAINRYSDLLVVKLLVALSLGLPLPLVLMTLAGVLIYPWIRENILAFSSDTGIRLIYSVLLHYAWRGLMLI